LLSFTYQTLREKVNSPQQSVDKRLERMTSEAERAAPCVEAHKPGDPGRLSRMAGCSRFVQYAPLWQAARDERA
jgi:hypothetical protein